MSDTIMAIRHITKTFPAGDGRVLTACRDISLDVERGKTLGIVGESGCGKSTLINTVLGFYPPEEGEVIFRGQDITRLHGGAKRLNYQHLQLVFQDPTAVFNPKMKIRDIICEPLLNFGRIKRSEVPARAAELLAAVELPAELADRYPHNMSGGQRQRVAIARALALEPEVIVCDEATSALDVSVQANIIRLLVRLQKEKGITYLFICHDLALVSQFTHQVAVMYLGSVVELIPGAELLHAAHPYSQALLASVFTIHSDRSKPVWTLDGDIPSPLDLPAGCPFADRCPRCTEHCRKVRPELRSLAPDHQVACHYAELE